MKRKIEKRHAELQREFAAGEKMMEDLEKRQDQLRETMLRISGAMQVLEDLLERPAEDAVNGVATMANTP